MTPLPPRLSLVRLHDVAPVPWRNGGGVTRELACAPGDEWRWRISVAEVARDGPFSRFDGVQRWFAVLQGAGVCLNIDGHGHRAGTLDAPLHFDGAADTDCRLVDGFTLNFNLMVRAASAASARVERLRTHALRTPAQQSTMGVYAIEATQLAVGDHTLQLPAHSLLWGQVAQTVALQGRHALYLEIDP